MGKLARANAERRAKIECFAKADIYQPTGSAVIKHGHSVPLAELPMVANDVLIEAARFFGQGHVVFECGLEDAEFELNARIRPGNMMQFPTRMKLVWADDPEWLSGITSRAFEALQMCLREKPFPCGRIDVFCANSNAMHIPTYEDLLKGSNFFHLEMDSVDELLSAQKRWNQK